MRTILPPPNVTGALHMGHAFEHTLIDILARRSRMRGEETIFQPGLDHAGIATQNVVERQLASEGLTRHQLGREAFLERAWAHKEKSAEKILSQMQLLQTSCDWDRLRFTFDEEHQLLTREAFTRLWEDGLLTRDERIVSRCPRCDTSLADIEVEEGTCTRCHTPIVEESSLQWFLHAERLAPLAKQAVLDGQITIDPPAARDEWLRWCDEIGPWCISRQLWWGHRIPMWYNSSGEARSFAAGETVPEGWTQDDDVLDTWFSSALWPMTLGGEYPASHLITGRDLLFFWALRMAMLCLHLTGRAPFEELHFHGMVRDEQGRKMSKSFGNVIDPVPLIEEHGADTLRLALAHASRPGLDVPFGDADLRWAKGLTRKLQSIHSYSMLHPHEGRAASEEIFDEWILGRLSETTREVDAFLDRYDHAGAIGAISRFLESDLSDTWIEASKSRMETPGARWTLHRSLQGILSLIAPFAPGLAEELDAPSLWPDEGTGARYDEEVESFRSALRTIRGERIRRGIASRDTLPARLEGTSLEATLTRLGRLETQELAEGPTWQFGELILQLPPSGLTEAERLKLDKELAQAERILNRSQVRLDSEDFLRKAPPAAIEEARRQCASATATIERVTSALKA